MITMGLCNPNVSIDWQLPIFVAISLNPNIGTKIGNYIYYQDYCCEITDKKDNKVCLFGLGWVDFDKCRLI